MPPDMPRPRPRFLHRETNRHGSTAWYVRKGQGPRTRIRAAFGTPEFEIEYQAAISGQTATSVVAPAESKASLKWLIDRYRASAEWSALSPATRRQRDNIFVHVVNKAGSKPFVSVTRATIIAGKDRRKETPFAANNFLKTMRGLFRWALENNHVAVDPTKDVSIAVPDTDGFHAWAEDEIELFEQRWPVGTRQRLALALLLYTGLRRGDVVELGRQHVRNGVLTLRTHKTGTVVTIPVLPELAAVIEATTTGDLAFIATAAGKPMTKEGFGNWFKDACVAAGVPGSAHGLRKAGATRAANNGATVAQLNAIFGWKGWKMAALYTETADRTRLAKEAMGKLSKVKPGTSIPAPIIPVRGKRRKT